MPAARTIFDPAHQAYLQSDEAFDELYPYRLRKVSSLHFTPVHVAIQAARFLATARSSILDVGSGAGKFCLAAACYAPDTRFTGIEQRSDLVQYAHKAQRRLAIENVTFISGNVIDADLSRYDHFYFYNPFYENIDERDHIDESIPYSQGLYDGYMHYFSLALQQMPRGTKLAAYHAFEDGPPAGYQKVASAENGRLNFMVRK